MSTFTGPKDMDLVKNLLPANMGNTCPDCAELNSRVAKEAAVLMFVGENWMRDNKDKFLEYKRAIDGYLCCQKCTDNMVKDRTWVKCSCKKEWSYLMINNHPDYLRTGKGLCVDCLKKFSVQKSQIDVKPKNEQKEYWNT